MIKIFKYRKRKKILTEKGTLIRPRLSIFKSRRHIYAQLINDLEDHTIYSFNSASTILKDGINRNLTQKAIIVGNVLKDKALSNNIRRVLFFIHKKNFKGIKAEFLKQFFSNDDILK
jgi:large subunit ribosomal protein L18